MTEQLERRIDLACPLDHGFRVFTEMTDLWWPRHHRRNEAAKLIMQPQHGGRLFEKSPDGSEWTIGEVVAITPPDGLEFNWFPGSPAAPTNVKVTFTATETGCAIHIRHSALSPEAMAAWSDKVSLFEKGWDTILPTLARFIETA